MMDYARTWLLTLFLVPLSGYGDIYRWRDAEGIINYSDQPPPKVDAERIELTTLPPSSTPTPMSKGLKPFLQQQQVPRAPAQAADPAATPSGKPAPTATQAPTQSKPGNHSRFQSIDNISDIKEQYRRRNTPDANRPDNRPSQRVTIPKSLNQKKADRIRRLEEGDT